MTPEKALKNFKLDLVRRLEEYCNKHNPPLSQRDLAPRVGLHFSTLNGYLRNGGETINLSFVTRLADHLPGFRDTLGEWRRVSDISRLPAEEAAAELRRQEVLASLERQVDTVKDGLDTILATVKLLTVDEGRKNE